MRTVWKFPLKITDQHVIAMPRDATVLHVAVQQGQPCIWTLVSPDAPAVTRTFNLRGTGHDVGEDIGDYVGSFFMRMETLVFHLWEAP